jgi:hypothetical protein
MQKGGKIKIFVKSRVAQESADVRYQAFAPFTVPVWVEDDDCGSWVFCRGIRISIAR